MCDISFTHTHTYKSFKYNWFVCLTVYSSNWIRNVCLTVDEFSFINSNIIQSNDEPNKNDEYVIVYTPSTWEKKQCLTTGYFYFLFYTKINMESTDNSTLFESKFDWKARWNNIRISWSAPYCVISMEIPLQLLSHQHSNHSVHSYNSIFPWFSLYFKVQHDSNGKKSSSSCELNFFPWVWIYTFNSTKSSYN